ncbi:MAG: arylesterase [Verrucomicrobiota bacterium]|jgi:acyl-CoA thioesterase-1
MRSGNVAKVIFFLIAMGVILEALAADPALTQSDRKTVVVLGDSLSAGLGVEPAQAFPALLQAKIDAAGWNCAVVNAGVSGDTSADGLARIDWLLRRRIDVLILALGGNDGLRGLPVSATKTNLQAIIDRTKRQYPQAQFIIAGMQMPPNMGEDYTTAFRGVFPELAATNHAALIPFLLEGVAGRPELNQEDRIHPTAEGHKIVAGNVWKVLKPVLETLNTATQPAARIPPDRGG